ncbi:TRAP transporter small permease [Prosthecomicrobium sp. N25]|uniref:TRAP transporter small permease n=1 Tax=Prosthecomicrobium sp. N25 TaxID=3129254 RepID=UPI0030786639
MSDPAAAPVEAPEVRHAGPVLGPLARWTAVAGGALTVLIALAVTASVLKRWATGGGIDGDFELVQIGTALAAFCFLPYCQARRGNIVVDTFTNALPARVRNTLDGLWDLVLAALVALMAWRLFVGAAEAFRTGTTSMVLGIQAGYAVAASAVLLALLAVTAAATAVMAIRGGR